MADIRFLVTNENRFLSEVSLLCWGFRIPSEFPVAMTWAIHKTNNLDFEKLEKDGFPIEVFNC